MRALIVRMKWPVLGLAAAIVLASFWPTIAGWLGAPEGSTGSEIVRQVCESLVLVAIAWIVMRLLHVAVWTGVMLRRQGHESC